MPADGAIYLGQVIGERRRDRRPATPSQTLNLFSRLPPTISNFFTSLMAVHPCGYCYQFLTQADHPDRTVELQQIRPGNH